MILATALVIATQLAAAGSELHNPGADASPAEGPAGEPAGEPALFCDETGGSMLVVVGGDRWSLGFAAAGIDGSQVSLWATRQLPAGGCELTMTIGESYRLQRRAERSSGGAFFEVTETFTNLRSDDVALWFEVNITADAESPGCLQRQWNTHTTEVGSTCIDVGGRYNLSHSASFGWMKFYDGHGTGPIYDDPPFNPSMYVRGRTSGLGVVALDDWMRRHLRIHKRASSGFFGSHSFGVPAKSQVNYTYALFVTPNSTDYYDFINLARDATVHVHTTHGPGAFIPYDFAAPGPNSWSTAKLQTLLRALGTKTAVICGPLSTGGAPWLGNDGYCNEFHFNLTDYLGQIGAACKRLKSIDPGISCLAPFETALSPCQLLPQNSTPPLPAWPDSVVITKSGLPAGYDWVYPHPKPGVPTVQYIYAPHQGNAYGNFLAERVQQALGVGMDGFYMDFFDYAMSENPSRQFRHTYNLTLTGWDGRSVDPVATQGRGPAAVARRKVDLNWMTTPARAAAIDAAIESSAMGRFAANGNAAGDSSAIRSRPVVRFWEGCEEASYTSTLLSPGAPHSLGWYDGYTQEVLSANLARPGLSEFWRTWDNCTGTDCDLNVFEDIKEKLSFGLLYWSYYPPGYVHPVTAGPALTLPSLLTRMYPITVRHLRPGTISGDERVITLHSGAYGFPRNATNNATLYCFNEDGVELAAVAGTSNDEGFEVTVPPNGACVLERQ